jgi:peptidoglycan/LPS O-acetylase OafA/YrhL
MSAPQRLHHLDSLRGIASLSVVLCHCIGGISSINSERYINQILGVIPVYFFFLLSGFVLSKSLSNSKPTISTFIKFIIRRILRLFPALLFSIFACNILFYYVAPNFNYSNYSEWIETLIHNSSFLSAPIDFIKSSFLLQKDPTYSPDPTWNPPLWTIRAEFACSGLLPITLFVGLKYRQLKIIIALLSAYFMSISGYHQPLPCFFAFFMGSVINDYFKSNHHHIPDCKFTLLITAAILILISQKITNNVVYTLILSQMLIVLIPCNWGFLKNLLLSKPLLFLGKVSYSLYLLHFPVMIAILGIFSYLNIVSHKLTNNAFISIVFLGTVAFTLVLAYFIELWVERPFNNIGHKLFK